MKKKPGCLGFFLGIILASYIGIIMKTIVRLYYLPTSISWKAGGSFSWLNWELGILWALGIIQQWPFSHNHGSVEHRPLNERRLILEGPIFHWTMIMGGRVSKHDFELPLLRFNIASIKTKGGWKINFPLRFVNFRGRSLKLWGCVYLFFAKC